MQGNKFKATIRFRVDSEHPDIQYIKNPDEIQEFSDTYTFSHRYTSLDYIHNYIKYDLSLVAGGGYNTDHIHDVEFDIVKL